MRLFFRRTTALVLVLAAMLGMVTSLCNGADGAALPASPRTVRFLSVGNSFSMNASAFAADLARAGGNTLIYENAMIGGCSLEYHLELAAKYEANHDDPAGRPYPIRVNGTEKKLSLAELLRLEKWDYVSIQQYSYLSFRPETFEPWGKELVAYIHKYAPQARILVHETWAYRADDPLFAKDFTQGDMYRKLHANYAQLAKDVGAVGILPVGTAFQNALEDPAWRPAAKIDTSLLQYPALPDQRHSLNAGYWWNKEKTPPEIGFDGHHASRLGCYLGGAVWCEYFFGDVRGNPLVPEGLNAADIAYLQKVAHETVAENRLPQIAGN